MDGSRLFMVFFAFIVIGYVVLYLGGRQYLREGFQSRRTGSGEAGAGSPTAGELYPAPLPVMPSTPSDEGTGNRVIMEQTTLDPVAKEAINSLDDYEHSLIFQNENDRELSTALRNKLMSQRPMDWAGLPPSSAQFQAGVRESFENASPTVPENAEPFRNVDGSNMVPPDTEATEMEERKILQSYRPPTAKDLSSYKPEEESPEQMIKRVYDVKGLIPTVDHKDGSNIYEVTGVRRKDEKVVYEDEEAPAAVEAVAAAGEATIQVPPQAYDTAAAADPYYNTTSRSATQGSRKGKWDYQAWTPGLERMFAPTEQRQNWY